ncbi:MAG: hypothetical protein ACJ76S_05375 [Solirubrobacteraceae bacterium]|jgi:hypothetical protein
MSLLDKARQALAGLTGGKPSGSSSEDERSKSNRRGSGDGGNARSTQDASSAPNPSVAAEEVD